MCVGTGEKTWEVDSFFFPAEGDQSITEEGSGAGSTTRAKGAFLGRKEMFEP